MYTRITGSRQEHLENFKVTLAMFAVTLAYEWVSSQIIPGFVFSGYEFLGTWAGLVCVWLCRTQNILCWPWGIVSAGALGYFFGTIGLPGQQWLNWGYFLIIQIWAWPYWAFGGAEKTELPVTMLTSRGWIGMLLAIVFGTYSIYVLIDLLVPGSLHPVLDATVVASSVVAQYLMGQKKVESWLLWLGPVNLLSIILFASAGAYTVMALYVAFFIHAFFATRTWYRARIINS